MTSDGRPPRLRWDTSGVSEVVGFIFMFAIAFLVLSLSMVIVSDRINANTRTNQRSTFIEAGSEVASAVQEAISFADAHPDATFERPISVPRPMLDANFEIVVTHRFVYVNNTRPQIDVNVRVGGFNLHSQNIQFDRTETRAPHLLLTYKKDSGQKTLTITETTP